MCKKKGQGQGQELLLPVREEAMTPMEKARTTQLLSFERKGLLLLACKGQDAAFVRRAQALDNEILARTIVMREKRAYIWRRNVALGILAFFVLVGGAVALILTLTRSDNPCESLSPLPYPWPVPTNFTWSDCTSNNTLNVLMQCISVHVPMSWVPNSPNCQSKQPIDIFVKRLFLDGPNTTSLTTQLWWVGKEVSSAYEADASRLVAAGKGALAVYLMDKRGTGLSSFFDCNPPSLFRSNVTACMSNFAGNSVAQDRLATTSYTNIAQDVIFLLECFKSADQRRVLMGSSMGGLVAQRVLSILGDTAPTYLDAVILDSAPPAAGFNLSESFLSSDNVALSVLTECHTSPDCAPHFTGGGLPSWMNVYGARDQLHRLGLSGHHPCLPLIPTSFGNLSWAIAFQLLQPFAWQLLPAVLLRLARCDANDLVALAAFAEQIPNVSSIDPTFPGSSFAVEWALDWTETFVGSLTSNDTARAVCDRLSGADALTFSSTKTTRMTCDGWRISSSFGSSNMLHAADSFTGSVPNLTLSLVPVLQLHGEWDPVVSIATAYNLALNYSSQSSNYTFVSVPRAAHTVFDTSPTDDESTCGFEMVLSFALSPQFEADTSCLRRLLLVDFQGDTDASRMQTLRFFNISSNASDAMWNA